MANARFVEVFGDFDQDGRRDKKPFSGKEWIIVPPLSPQTPDAPPVATLLLRAPDETDRISVGLGGGENVRLWMRTGGTWREPPLAPPSGSPAPRRIYLLPPSGKEGVEIGVTVTLPLPLTGFNLEIFLFGSGVGQTLECRIAPILLTSALDPAEEVFVVRNPLNRKFVAELSRIVAQAEGKPKLRMIDTAAASSDLWIQDSVEIGRFSYPTRGGKVAQGVAPILGLRAKHDRGLNCGPLDTAVRAYFDNAMPDAAPIEVGEPLPERRWIDWFGNMEVSPPVKGFPHGRILTGDQKGLRFHPEVLHFLELQKIQWPPLFLDVGWLTIGHVDETINFVAAPDRQRFRALLPSPALACRILEEAARAGHGDAAVFAGRQEGRKNAETTVTRLLDDVARSKESGAIDAALKETRQQVKSGLGIEDADIIEIPALFADGLAVIPNMVNCLVLGRDLVIPAPAGPILNGEDAFEKAVRLQLEPLGARLHFVDIWEPYHTRSGEIHCGTNALRRLRNPFWWKSVGQ